MQFLKTILFLFILIIALSCTGNSIETSIYKKPPLSGYKKRNKTSSEILVRFKPDTDPDKIREIQDKYGLETVKPLSTPGLFLMKITGEMPVETIIKELKKQSEVIYAEPDYRYKINAE